MGNDGKGGRGQLEGDGYVEGEEQGEALTKYKKRLIKSLLHLRHGFMSALSLSYHGQLFLFFLHTRDYFFVYFFQ